MQLALAEAEDDVSLLRNFHEHAGRRSLANDDVDGLIAVDAISDVKNEAVRMQEATGFRDTLADEIGHVDFAAVDGNAHRRDGAEERGGGKDEDEKGHPRDPLELFLERHGDGLC